ncbi:MAG: hypothetical protein WA810_15230 [Maribacter sp.]
MRTIPYKGIWLFTLLFTIFTSANDQGLNGKHTKEKTIKKEFNVNTNALLKIDNAYGNLNITSWNENRVVIEVHIKTNGNNEEKVQKKLDEITVNFEASQEMVMAKTMFTKNNSGWGWSWGNSNNVNMQINYTIKVPVKNNVDLNNDYGTIILDRIDGHAKINCDYGRLELGELRGRNNRLNFDYTSKSTINYINSGEIRADYSGFTVDKAGDLIINADYTNVNIGVMGNLDYTSDYGNMEIAELKSVQGKGDYITVKLGLVHGNVDIVADYGAVRIDELAADAGDVTIRTDYTGIKIGYNAQYHFDFNINTSYAGVSGKEEFIILKSIEKSSDRYYEGYFGSKGSGNTITLSSDYGDINFTKK